MSQTMYNIIKFKILYYLYTWFGETNLERDFFSHEDVRVSRLGKQRLEDVQLRSCEGGPLSTLFSRVTWAPHL